MSNQVYISQDANAVNLVNTDKQLVITEIGSGTSVNVTQPITSVITVASAGPQGQSGPAGPQGPSGSLQSNSSGSFQITGSLLLTGSAPLTVIGSTVLSGSLSVTQGITGSLLGTASYSINTLSASYSSVATSASYALTASYADNVPATASYALQALSSSYAVTASYASNVPSTASYALQALSSSYTVTASAVQGGSAGYIPLWKSDNTLGTSSFHQDDGNVGLGVLLPEAKLHVKGPGSTDLYTSLLIQNSNGNPSFVVLGSGHVGIENLFPSYELDVTGTGRFTNGLLITGSLKAPSITGSLEGTASQAVSSSYALTASYVENAQSASFVLNAVSASYALTASYVNPLRQNLIITGSVIISGSSTFTNIGPAIFSGSIIATSITSSLLGTASVALNTVSASFATTASYALTTTSASYTATASYALTTTSASFAATAQNVTGTVTSASFATTSSYWTGPLSSLSDVIDYTPGSIADGYQLAWSSGSQEWIPAAGAAAKGVVRLFISANRSNAAAFYFTSITVTADSKASPDANTAFMITTTLLSKVTVYLREDVAGTNSVRVDLSKNANGSAFSNATSSIANSTVTLSPNTVGTYTFTGLTLNQFDSIHVKVTPTGAPGQMYGIVIIE